MSDAKEKDLLDRLKSKCPKTFKNLDYVSCQEGWGDLLEAISKIIERQIEDMPSELGEQIYATQIKQKFGGLRYYMSHETPFIDGAIAMAEAMSYNICEFCGCPAKHRTIGGWITTLCDKHFKSESKRIDMSLKKYRKKVAQQNKKPAKK